MENNNSIFIHALSQRCGHNFLAQLIQSQLKVEVFVHKNHEVIIPELLASKMDELENSKRFVRNKKAKKEEITKAASNYISSQKQCIYKTSKLKSEYEVDLFPDIKHLILVRHPQDLFVSYEKSIYNFRTLTLKNRIKKLFRPLYSYYVLNAWAKELSDSIQLLKSIKTPYLLIKYENLLQLEGQKQVFKFLDIPFEKEKVINIKNSNSSFSENNKRWKTSSGNIGDTTLRFKKSSWWLKWMIRKNLKKHTNSLNYPLK